MSASNVMDEKMRTDPSRKIVPNRMAHIVFKTLLYQDMIAWYKTVFHAEPVFVNDVITFLTFDDEHHRFALYDMSSKGTKAPPNAAGVMHFAFTYDDVADLVSTYERLKAVGITPSTSTNHELTVSMYYRDPDGNQIELQADIFATAEESKAVFQSARFKEKPFGRVYDPDTFSSGFRNGEPLAQVMARAEALAGA